LIKKSNKQGRKFCLVYNLNKKKKLSKTVTWKHFIWLNLSIFAWKFWTIKNVLRGASIYGRIKTFYDISEADILVIDFIMSNNVENWLDSIFQPDYTCFGCASLFNRSPNWNFFHLIFCSILHILIPWIKRLSLYWGYCCHPWSKAVPNSWMFWHFVVRAFTFRPNFFHLIFCSILHTHFCEL
jgi:hypothetical protein